MTFFKRPAAHYGKMPEPETPYQRAAQVWDERIGSARVQARNWRLMAFGCLILSAGFAAALVWQSARGTIVPWVVQVDNLGQAQAVAPAQADYRPTDPQVAWHLARFIEQVRSIPADAIVVRQNWLRAYEFTTDRGAAALNDYPQPPASQRQAVPATPVIPAVAARNYRYGMTGNTPPWRPLSVYDDGRRVYVEFPRGIVQGEMPPLFVIGADGEPQIANSRIHQNILIVDRLFGAAELRLGSGERQQTVRIVRTDGRPAS